MMIFILYDWLFADYDLPFVSIHGLSSLLACALYGVFCVGFILCLERWIKATGKVRLHLVFMDMFFVQATGLLAKQMLSAAVLGFDQSQDWQDIICIGFTFYLVGFRLPAWGLLK